MKLVSSRKEDELYFQGPFWVIGKSFKDILSGDFQIVARKELCDYTGKYTNFKESKSHLSHRVVWETIKKEINPDVSYTYYPRGRVAISDGKYWIHINSQCDTPEIISAIESEYPCGKLEVVKDFNDVYQGSHYEFELPYDV